MLIACVLGLLQPGASAPLVPGPRSVVADMSASANASLVITVDAATGAFNVSLGAALWLRGLPPAAGWAGGNPLSLKRVDPASSGSHPTLGPFSERRFFWTSADDVDVHVSSGYG